MLRICIKKEYMNTETNILFSLESIEEILYSISSCDSMAHTCINRETLRVQFMTQTFLNIKNNQVKIKVGTKYDIQEVSVLNLELLFVFGINNIDNLVSVDRDNMKLNFKADLIPTFINVAIGGMRGVLYEKVKSTILEAYPLPLIDLQELIKQNTFHVEE